MWMDVLVIGAFILMVGWYPCCTGGGVPPYVHCSQCTGAGDNAPQYMTAVLADIANADCSDCTDFNGTYVCEYVPSSNCNWTIGVDTVCLQFGGSEPYDLTVQATASFNMIASLLFDGYNRAYWQDASTPQTCLAFDELEMAYWKVVNYDDECDFTSSTCTISSGDIT